MRDISFGTIWDRTTGFVSEQRGAIVAIAGAFIILPQLVWTSIAPLSKVSSPGVQMVVALAIVALFLVAFFGSLAIVALALDPAAGRGTALQRAGARLLSALGLWLLLGIVIALLASPIFIALHSAGLDMRALSSGRPPSLRPSGATTFAGLYGLVLIVVIVWLYARLVLLLPVIVSERVGLNAFARSFALTRGLTGKIIGMLLLYWIVSTVAGLAAQFVFGAVFRIVLPGDGAVSVASVATAAVVTAVAMVFAVLAGVFKTLLYRAANEGEPSAR